MVEKYMLIPRRAQSDVNQCRDPWISGSRGFYIFLLGSVVEREGQNATHRFLGYRDSSPSSVPAIAALRGIRYTHDQMTTLFHFCLDSANVDANEFTHASLPKFESYHRFLTKILTIARIITYL